MPFLLESNHCTGLWEAMGLAAEAFLVSSYQMWLLACAWLLKEAAQTSCLCRARSSALGKDQGTQRVLPSPWFWKDHLFLIPGPRLSGSQDTNYHSRMKWRRWDLGGSGSEGVCLNNCPCFLPQVALEMLFTGDPISAQEALLHGLLSRVVPEEQLEEETMRIARKIASLSRPVVSLGKAAFYKHLCQDLRTAYHLASQTMVDNVALQDGQEGIKAFIQKRKPVWS